ncbi:hypothetical protein CPB86DRAFT_818545 [Serendipita vermifera]|nr:hypothetical protein CPB86DRAFT_818545 [Serendipita vermifera]
MSSYANLHTYNMSVPKFVTDDADIFDLDNNLLSTSPTHMCMGNNTPVGSSTSYQESGHGMQGFLNSFPAPPQHTNSSHLEPKAVPNTQPARVSNVSNLTAQFRAHQEAMNYQSVPSQMQTMVTYIYQHSLPSSYSPPTGMTTEMTSLDHDHGVSSTNMPWEMVPITGRRAHQQTSSPSHSFAPYTRSSLPEHDGRLAGGSGSNITPSAIPRSVESSSNFGAGFTPEQIPAA